MSLPKTLYQFDPKNLRKITMSPVRMRTEEERAADCKVYWGSHGCDLPKGHEGHHRCDCCECEDHATKPEAGCVGSFPYYGPKTTFYGEDAG